MIGSDALDALWQEVLAGEPLLDRRPSFRVDPDLDPTTPFPNHATRVMATHPGVADEVLDLVTHPALLALAADDRAGAAELAYELVRLGQGVDVAVARFSCADYLDDDPALVTAGVDPLEHYLVTGRREGRWGLRELLEATVAGGRSYDPDRPTCLLLLHALDRTGAPIIGRDLARSAAHSHNVVVHAPRTGDLLDEVAEHAVAVVVSPSPWHGVAWCRHRGIDLHVAVVNSAEAAETLPALVAAELPIVSYVHEFGATAPPHVRPLVAAGSDLVVFPAEVVRRSWLGVLADHEVDVERDTCLLPQRRLGTTSRTAASTAEARARLSARLGLDLTGRRVVYGAGTACWRKGTDLFLLTAQLVRAVDPDTVFLWVGAEVDEDDPAMGAFLAQHVEEATTDPGILVLPPGPVYDDVVAAADVLFLSSRLDPLPNVVFEAVAAGAAVVRFDGVTGFDDPAHRDHPALHRVPFGDLTAAAEAVRSVAPPAPTGTPPAPEPALLPELLALLDGQRRAVTSRVAGIGSQPESLLFPAFPRAELWRQRERERLRGLGRRVLWHDGDDARAALDRSDHPVHRSLRVVDEASLAPSDEATPPFGLHLHAHHLDDLDATVDLAVVRRARRLVITTDTAGKAARVGAVLRDGGHDGEVLVVPNLGRDVLPFLDLFAPGGPGRDEEVWCHLHEKRSIHAGAHGVAWRRFLLHHVAGDAERLAPVVATLTDPTIGLATAFDRTYGQWNGARRLLPAVETRLAVDLPSNPLCFPVGNMFWVRRPVVDRMRAAFPDDQHWPPEPVPLDGTVYHLIERLWPTMAHLEDTTSVFVEGTRTRGDFL